MKFKKQLKKMKQITLIMSNIIYNATVIQNEEVTYNILMECDEIIN